MKKIGGYCHKCARPRISCVCHRQHRKGGMSYEYHAALDEIEEVARLVNQAYPPDQSVSQGARGEVRQRRPKPELRIHWHPITRQPHYVPLNHEGIHLMHLLLLTSENYQYYRGGIIQRLKPKNP